MSILAGPHQSDDQLELYALGRLPEQSTAAVEEHLLICVACQERLDEIEAFSLAMREAISTEPPARSFRLWPALPRWSFAAAAVFASLALALILYTHSPHNLGPIASVHLTAIRGETPSVRQSRETDISLTDAPHETSLRLEVVDSAGGSMWSGPLNATSPEAKIARELAPGTYFVRLYDGAGKLLHEYGFRVTL